jgi:hypothetical protein
MSDHLIELFRPEWLHDGEYELAMGLLLPDNDCVHGWQPGYPGAPECKCWELTVRDDERQREANMFGTGPHVEDPDFPGCFW